MTFGPAETVKFLMDEFSDAASRIVENPQTGGVEVPKVNKLINHIAVAARGLPAEELTRITLEVGTKADAISRAINEESHSLIRQSAEIAEASCGKSEQEVAALLRIFRAPGR